MRYSNLTDVWSPSPNYEFGRRGLVVRYVVLHTTEGSGQGSVDWLRNPATQVSAHYVVMEDGRLVAMVGEEHTAWHAGRIVGIPVTEVYDGTNPNYVSIGIEVAGYAVAPMGPQQLTTTAALVRDIRNRYGPIPVVQHAWLSPGDRSDPGDFNYYWVMSEVDEEDGLNAEETKAEIRNMLTSPEGANLVEFAIARSGGFGDKLAEALGRRMEQAVRDAMAEALRTMKEV